MWQARIRPVLVPSLVSLAMGAGVAILALRADACGESGIRRSAPTVRAITDLARLETVRYHMERVIAAEEAQERFGGLLQGRDEILLVAACDIEAGVDLSKLAESDMEVDETRTRVTLYLPRAEIFDVHLDSERTYVYRRDQTLFATASLDLESRARRAAETELREQAIAAGILDRARENAERTLTTMLRELGFQEVRFAPRLLSD